MKDLTSRSHMRASRSPAYASDSAMVFHRRSLEVRHLSYRMMCISVEACLRRSGYDGATCDTRTRAKELIDRPAPV